MKLSSLIPLLTGVAVPLGAMLIPQLQELAKNNIWVAAGLSAGLVLWNHFITPVNAPNPPVKQL